MNAYDLREEDGDSGGISAKHSSPEKSSAHVYTSFSASVSGAPASMCTRSRVRGCRARRLLSAARCAAVSPSDIGLDAADAGCDGSTGTGTGETEMAEVAVAVAEAETEIGTQPPLAVTPPPSSGSAEREAALESL